MDVFQGLFGKQHHRQEYVVELMRQSAGERTHRRQPLLVPQMGFQNRALRLFAFALNHFRPQPRGGADELFAHVFEIPCQIHDLDHGGVGSEVFSGVPHRRSARCILQLGEGS